MGNTDNGYDDRQDRIDCPRTSFLRPKYIPEVEDDLIVDNDLARTVNNELSHMGHDESGVHTKQVW